MVAYSFQPQFVPPMLARTKTHTLRWPRRGRSRHAREGEVIQHYTGMRTKRCQRQGLSVCTLRDRVIIIMHRMSVRLMLTDAPIEVCEAAEFPEDIDGEWLSYAGLREFAKADGFDRVGTFHRYWVGQAPRLPAWGKLERIGWSQTFVADAEPGPYAGQSTELDSILDHALGASHG